MEKIKLFLTSDTGKDIMIVIIVILVGIASFELGRLSKENEPNGVKIEYAGKQEANVINSLEMVKFANSDNTSGSTKTASTGNVDASGKSFFASSRGSKYYSVGCSAGKTIKQENRIYFATGEEATAAGYTLSSSCK